MIDISKATKSKPPKLLFFISEDWYFCSHRKRLAQEALRKGFQILIVTRVGNFADEIKDAGFQLINLPIRRGGWNLLADLIILYRLCIIYRKEKPDLVHHVALKPILYGTMAAMISGVKCVVNAFAGLGHIFIASTKSYKVLRKILLIIMKCLFRRRKINIIFQNDDDRQIFLQQRVVPFKKTSIIRGSGVELDIFYPSYGLIKQPPLIVLVGRMLKTKGVEDFTQAARILKNRGKNIQMVLVGPTDDENPASIPNKTLLKWKMRGYVDYWGERSDIARIYRSSTLAVLPSYREGLPKSLMEAAACGVPMVAYDVPGCREIVRPFTTGLLVPKGDVTSLANAIERLLDDSQLRKRCSINAQMIAKKEFDQSKVIAATLSIYDMLIK